MSALGQKTGDGGQAPMAVTARDRLAARLSVVGGAPQAVAFSPRPLFTGDADAATRLVAGDWRLAGVHVSAPGASPWSIKAPSGPWADALHGFDWLADLGAARPAARTALAALVFDWIARYGGGAGPGWRPEVTARRIANWTRFAPILQAEAGPEEGPAFLRALGRSIRFLRRRWRAAPEGAPRIEAAAGLIYAALALEGPHEEPVVEAARILGAEARRAIDRRGAVHSRSPEDQAEIFAHLVAAAGALEAAGRAPDPAHAAALAPMATVLRALRHEDGALLRGQGGGAGRPTRIDRVLSASGVRPAARPVEAMGYHRLSSGRATVFFDAGATRAGKTGPNAGAKTAAHAGFAVSSAFSVETAFNRLPMIISCGPGAKFGDLWREPTRAAPAFSGLMIDDLTVSQVAAALTLSPEQVAVQREQTSTGVSLAAQHDGWIKTHGLSHERRLTLSADGDELRGEDRLSALGAGPRATFDQAAGRRNRMKVPFTIRFHLHPDVEAELFLAGGAVRLTDAAGQDWVMRQLGGELALEDSAFLDEALGAPRATKQIVVRADAADYRGTVKWAFRRAETPRPSPRDAV